MSTGAQMLTGSLALFLVSTLTGELNGFSFASVTFNSWMGLLYLITIGSLIGFVSYGWLLQNAPVSLVATYAYVNPLVAVFLGAWLADEVINMRILVAGLVIIGSVALINRSKPGKPKLVKQEILGAGETEEPPGKVNTHLADAELEVV